MESENGKNDVQLFSKRLVSITFHGWWQIIEEDGMVFWKERSAILMVDGQSNEKCSEMSEWSHDVLC